MTRELQLLMSLSMTKNDQTHVLISIEFMVLSLSYLREMKHWWGGRGEEVANTLWSSKLILGSMLKVTLGVSQETNACQSSIVGQPYSRLAPYSLYYFPGPEIIKMIFNYSNN